MSWPGLAEPKPLPTADAGTFEQHAATHPVPDAASACRPAVGPGRASVKKEKQGSQRDSGGPWSHDHEPPPAARRRRPHFFVDTVTFSGLVSVWPFEFTSTPTYWYTPLRRPEMSTDALCGFGLDGVSDTVDTSTPFS